MARSRQTTKWRSREMYCPGIRKQARSFPSLFNVAHHFLVEFADLFSNQFEHLLSLGSEPVILARPFAGAWVGAAFEPAQPFHPRQQRIQGARADVVTVVAQLGEHPMPVQRFLAGVVQDVRLPETQQDFAADVIHVDSVVIRRGMSKTAIQFLTLSTASPLR